MEQCDKGGRIGDWLWLLAWGIASSISCLAATRAIGPTFDEPLYVARGLEVWRTGSHAGLMKLGTMPLPIDAVTLPLYLWERIQGVPFDAERDLAQILPWARAVTLAFWWLLLIYGWLIGRRLAGPWGGRLAVALLASEPCLLAHASLATTDIALTACLLALVYHFQANRDSGWSWRVGLPAAWFAAAVLAKASGLVFGPLCMLVIELVRLAQIGVTSPKMRQSIRDLLQIGVLGMVLVFVYCGTDGRPQASFVAWAHKLPEGRLSGRSMVWLSENLCIFSNAGEGLIRQIRHNFRGHGAYLLGETSPTAIWYYFPVALTIKLSAFLLLLPLVIVLVRPRAFLNWACAAAAVLLLFSLNCRVQIGIRLVLPLVALAAIGLAAALTKAWQEGSPAWRRTLAVLVPAGVASTVLASVTVWPHGLCFVNPFWGGTTNGYRLLSDSNYDWGQGLGELAAWERQHGLDSLDVWYFGGDPAIYQLPLRLVQLNTQPIAGPADVLRRVHGHFLAVSTTVLYGSFNTEDHRRAAEFLRTCRPVDRTTTFIIFDFTETDPPATDEAG